MQTKICITCSERHVFKYEKETELNIIGYEFMKVHNQNTKTTEFDVK